MSKTVFLDSGSASIQHLCRKDKRFAKLFSMIGPISYTTYEGGYAFLVHEVIEQMISTRAAAKIYARLEALCGGSVTVERISALSQPDQKHRIIREEGSDHTLPDRSRQGWNARPRGSFCPP